MDRKIVSAQGKVLALLATLLERAGVVTAAEFGAMLLAFSDLDDDAEQSAIIAQWADIVRDAADLAEPPSG